MKNKNRFKLFGLAILVTAIVFSHIACGGAGAGGGGSGGNSVVAQEPTSTKFESVDTDGNTYVLEITKASGRVAAYTPKNGDNFVLTIINKDGSTKTSKGTITTIKGDSLTLTPTGSSTSFEVKIESTNTNVLMTAITGTIVTDNGKVEPKSMSPVKTYDTFNLGAHWWEGANSNSGQKWQNGINLSDFTTKRPSAGDKLNFVISGNPDKPLNWCFVSLEAESDNWKNYMFLGNTGERKSFSSNSENNFTITIYNTNEYDSSWNLWVTFGNDLWVINKDGDIEFDSGETLPENTPYGKTMATIRNFKIRLVNN